MTGARLHPDAASFLQECARVGVPAIATTSVAEARRGARQCQALANRPVDTHVPRADAFMLAGGRGIAARVYRPETVHPGSIGTPALVWFHGGGFVLGDLDDADDICARLALEASATVVSIDYRRAPEHPWPAAHHDAVDAVTWVLDRGAEYGIDTSRVAVGGDSAGGHLAAWAAREVAATQGDRLRLQLLFYPVLSTMMATASYRDFAVGFGLDADAMRWFFDHLAIGAEGSVRPFDLDATAPPSGLAPLHVITGECDVVRDEAEAYARHLADSGIPVTSARFLGMPHGFAQMTGVTPQAEASLAGAGHALRTALSHRRTSSVSQQRGR